MKDNSFDINGYQKSNFNRIFVVHFGYLTTYPNYFSWHHIYFPDSLQPQRQHQIDPRRDTTRSLEIVYYIWRYNWYKEYSFLCILDKIIGYVFIPLKDGFVSLLPESSDSILKASLSSILKKKWSYWVETYLHMIYKESFSFF